MRSCVSGPGRSNGSKPSSDCGIASYGSAHLLGCYLTPAGSGGRVSRVMRASAVKVTWQRTGSAAAEVGGACRAGGLQALVGEPDGYGAIADGGRGTLD